MKKTNYYSSNLLTMAIEEKESLIEQFKEEQDDGMERI